VNDINRGGLILLETGPKGLGVFATRSYRRGEPVLAFGGPFLSSAEIADYTHVIQVDDELFLGASGGLDDYVNHSCDPNCVLRWAPLSLSLVASKSIEAGAEITFDYSTCIDAEPGLHSCMCGSVRCRGRVVPFRELDRLTRSRYLRLGAVPPFVRQRRPLSVPARVLRT
jgi:SET domain-containing protein